MPEQAEITLDLDGSTLRALLDDVAEFVNGLPNEKLQHFIRNAFHVTNDPTEGARNLASLIFKPNARYLDLLPALRAGELSFDRLCDILAAKVGIGNKADHEQAPSIKQS